jgi:hypothetical protein
MIKFIWSAVLLSFVLLLTVTIILARLNWNDEVRGRVYSIVLGGTGALLLVILSALKPSSFQKAFVAPVPFNDAAGGPPLTGAVKTRDGTNSRCLQDQQFQRMDRLSLR